MGYNGVRFPNEDSNYDNSGRAADSNGIAHWWKLDTGSTPEANEIILNSVPQVDIETINNWSVESTIKVDGSSRNATDSGTRLATPTSGAECVFDNWTTSDDYTIACWLYITGIAANGIDYGGGKYSWRVLGKNGGGSGIIACEIWDTSADNSSGTFGFHTIHHKTAAQQNAWSTSSSLISKNTWHHLAWVYQGGIDDEVTFYLDGSSQEAVAITDPGMGFIGTATWQFADQGSAQVPEGYMDQIEVWYNTLITDWSIPAAGGIQQYTMHHINHNCNVHKDGRIVEPDFNTIYDINNHRRF
jgi:hypothetical protein